MSTTAEIPKCFATTARGGTACGETGDTCPSVSDFQRAIELDPLSTQAEVWLGNAYFNLGMYGIMPPAVAFEKARQVTEQALKLDPDFAFAHAQRGDIHRAYDWDWAAADRELKLALALAPNDGQILFRAAVQSLGMGRCDDALTQINAAIARDPLESDSYGNLGLIQSCRGRLEEAEEAQRRKLDFGKQGSGAHFFLGQVLLARGEPEAALAEMLKETREDVRLGGSAMAYFALGSKADSDAALSQLLKSQADRTSFLIADVYGFRGEPDEAFKWLERAYAQKDPNLALFIKSQAMFSKLQSDPRYKALLRKMNFPDD
jgi:tetratricopeptide (TPR) repeat protein